MKRSIFVWVQVPRAHRHIKWEFDGTRGVMQEAGEAAYYCRVEEFWSGVEIQVFPNEPIPQILFSKRILDTQTSGHMS